MVEWTSQKSTKKWYTIGFTSLRFWRYHFYLLIWRCLSNYDVRYLCAYIKSHKSDFFFANVVEATFAVFLSVFFICVFLRLLFLHMYICYEPTFSTKYLSHPFCSIYRDSFDYVRYSEKLIFITNPYWTCMILNS